MTLQRGTTRSENQQRRLHVISNTHWDREWRYSLWKNRQMLMVLMDRLIELMEQNPEYKYFILDGQSVVVQDYLEMRPEQASRLKALIRAERIQVGPWYTLPHQFAVSGESLVRNLMLGIKKARDYGGACMIGYTVFSFGQVSQIPQIYAGFGIDKIMVCKRVSKERAPACEFFWESPDGTRALATRYGDHGRGNYFYFVFIPALFGMRLFDPEVIRLNPAWDYDYSKGGRPCHLVDSGSYTEDTFLLDSPHGWYPDCIPSGLKDCEYSVRESTVPSPALYSESADFCHPTLESIKIINEGNKHLDDAVLVHSNVVDFMNELSSAVNAKQLKIVKGELRDGPSWAVQASINSAGIPIRLKNFKSETGLCAVAEPLATLAYAVGAEYNYAMLDRAWEYLLKAHPHDSITGSGDKSVWSNTLYRLDQVSDIASTLTTIAVQNIVSNLNNSDEPDDAVLLTVFNTLGHKRNANIEVILDLPGKNPVNGFDIVDVAGSAVPFQVLDHTVTKVPVISTINRPMPYVANRYRIRALFHDIPACGYKTYRVKYETGVYTGLCFSMPGTDSGSLLTSSHCMENEFLRVRINTDGTLDITRKESGHAFKGLLYFEDRGNKGICHLRDYPRHDQIITSHHYPTDISIIESGPQCCAFKIEKTMLVPAELTDDGNSRSSQKKELKIMYVVRLVAKVRAVDIAMEIENASKNHITCMVFPTWLKTDYSYSDTPFDVSTRLLSHRSVEAPADKPLDEQPCYSFIDISDGTEGLAILTGGIGSYEISDRPDRALHVPIIRAYDCKVDCGEAVMNSYPDWEHTQCMGKHKFHFALYPHTGDWEQGEVVQQAAWFSVPVKAAQHGKGSGTLPMSQSWFSLQPDVLKLSTLKKAENDDNLIIRFFNPTSKCRMANLTLADCFTEAWLCDLSENRLKQVEIQNGAAQLRVEAKKIITVEVSR
jgi:mannosylglycerate hydrolase